MNTEHAAADPQRRRSRERLTIVASGLAMVLVAAGIYAAHGMLGHTPPHTRGVAGVAAASSGHDVATCHLPAGTAFVAEPGFQAAGEIDAGNCTLTATLNVDDNGEPGDEQDVQYDSTAEGMTASANGSLLYFADTSINDVVVITANSAFVQKAVIPVGFGPEGLAITPNGKQLWVADTGPQTGAGSPGGVSIINTATNKVTATLPITHGPQQVAFSPNGRFAYITTSSALLVIDAATHSLVAQVPGLDQPVGVAVSPNGADVYVTDSGDSRVSVIDAATNRVAASIPVGELPLAVTVSPDGQSAYVASADSNEVSVIDTATDKVVQVYPVRNDPAALTLADNGKYLWVSALESNDVDVINTVNGGRVATITVGIGNEPTDIAIIPASRS